MKKRNACILLLGLVLTTGCGSKHDNPGGAEVAESTELSLELEGDSTIYGLVCDGTNDTLLVYLPANNIGANPDTLNVLAATRQHHIYGYPKVGDKVAIMRNGNDSTVADIVIDTEQLHGSWCYLARPTLRQRADITEKMQQQLLKEMPDSVRDSLMAPREYGIQIKGDNAARSIGFRFAQQDENSPVEYPQAKRYTIWNLYNGCLLLTETSIDSTGQRHLGHTDTAQFVLMRRDTLALRIGDKVQGFYRKTENDSI